MSIPHTVRAGETLSSIARRYNIASWREIYWHDVNKDFRRKRPNENLIFPGDVVIIPGGPAGSNGANRTRPWTLSLRQQGGRGCHRLRPGERPPAALRR